MVKEASTSENLSFIGDKNRARRPSLVLNEDYNSDDLKPEDEDDVKEVIATKEDESVAQRLRSRRKPADAAATDKDASPDGNSDKYGDVDQIVKRYNEIKNSHPTRLNKRAKSPSDNKYKSRFSDIAFYERLTTIFDSNYIQDSEFFGIYVLFWLGTAFLVFNSLFHSFFEHSEWFYKAPVVQTMKKDVIKVGLTDLGMYLTSYFSFFLQYLCKNNWISWDLSGWIIQVVYDFLHLVFWLFFASDLVMGFPWIAKVFLILHSFVFLMKMHSYGFYNGYLWRIYNELNFSQALLDKINNGNSSLTGEEAENAKKVLIESVTFCKFELEYQSQTTSMDTEVTVNPEDVKDDILELQKSKKILFPQNISLFNFFEYSLFPTLVYTLNYPRTKRIRWRYLGKKIIGIFGIIFLMILVAQTSMYPLVQKAIASRKLPYLEKSRAYVFILIDMIPPFLLLYLLTFFLIWDAILNAIAELSRFADRDFYGPWWSCTDWSEYSRIWNRPVHKFLLRHVYHSSISAFSLNKIQAAMITFMLSSLVHELVMFVIFGTLRGYLLCLQMSQIPLVMLSRTKLMRDKKVLGNVICWFGFISGPSMICTLYLIF